MVITPECIYGCINLLSTSSCHRKQNLRLSSVYVTWLSIGYGCFHAFTAYWPPFSLEVRGAFEFRICPSAVPLVGWFNRKVSWRKIPKIAYRLITSRIDLTARHHRLLNITRNATVLCSLLSALSDFTVHRTNKLISNNNKLSYRCFIVVVLSLYCEGEIQSFQ